MPDLAKPAVPVEPVPPGAVDAEYIPAGRLSAAELLAARERVARVAAWMDGGVRLPVPGLNRIGLDSIIGLIPVAGDVIGALVSLLIVYEARRLGAPAALQRKLLRNGVVDGVVGLVPFVGDAADFFFRGNRRNADLLLAHIDQRLGRTAEKKPHSPWWLWAGLGLALLAAGVAWWHVRG